MRPIPAPRIGDSHGILRAVADRERLRLDEFLTSANVEDMFPEGLENALGRMRQFLSYARAAGLLREDRGVVELTEIGKRYARAGDPEHPYDVSRPQAEWLRRQLFDKHMTDSIFHGLAIGLSLLSSVPRGTRVSTLDFGRSLAYLGRAGWDNENTLQIQGERYLVLLRDMQLIDDERALTQAGFETKAELTLPVHMSLADIAGQLNPDGPAGVAADAEAEWAALRAAPGDTEADEADDEASVPVAAEPEPAAAADPVAAGEEEDEWADVGPGQWAALEDQPAEPPPTVVPQAEPPPTAPREPVAEPREPVAEPREPVAEPPEPVAGPREPVAEPAEPVAEPREEAATVISSGAAQLSPAEPAALPEPAAPPEPAASSPPAAARGPETFVAGTDIRAAAEKHGLRLPGAVYANVAAALAGGRHLLLVGPPGAGKTTLALAIAEAAAGNGRAAGAALMTVSRDWQPGDAIIDAAQLGRWLVADDLDRADLDDSLGGLASFLGGLPVALPGRDGELRAARDWRLLATASTIPTASVALLGRFATVELLPPADADMTALLTAAAGGDEVASAAARRLLPLRDIRALGAGVFIAAARHGAARRAEVPAGESALTRELHAAYVAPLLAGLDPDGEQRVRSFLDAL